MLVLQLRVQGMCKRLSSFLKHDNEQKETQMGGTSRASMRWGTCSHASGNGESATCKQLGASIQMGREDDDCMRHMDGNQDEHACESVKFQAPMLKGWVPFVVCVPPS
eukprot:scaffold1407_cov379-Pavlova_lutheri.AAC.5